MKLILPLLCVLSLLLWHCCARAQEKALPLNDLRKNEVQRITGGKQLLIVGEVHGTAEAPEAVYLLAKQLRSTGMKIQVGLEISTVDQPYVDSFFQSGDTGILNRMPFFTSSVKDGRSSKAMKALMVKTRGLKHVDLFCFDHKMGTSQERDSMMAETIKSGLSTGVFTIVLVGNLHAMRDTVSFGPGVPPFKPLAYFLARNHKIPMLALNTSFAGGTAWNCRDEGCRVYSLGSHPELVNKYGTQPLLLLNTSIRGYDGCIYFPQATASNPLFN